MISTIIPEIAPEVDQGGHIITAQIFLEYFLLLGGMEPNKSLNSIGVIITTN
jgi:hypothetical protein